MRILNITLLKAANLWLAAFLLLSSCSHYEVSQTPADSLRFFFTQSRNLELEPCGCSYNPLGGVGREANVLEQLRKKTIPTLFLSSGPTFTSNIEVTPTKQQKLKQDIYAESLSHLAVDLISVGSEDLVLGLNRLKELESKSKTTLLSCNAYLKKTGKPAFKTFIDQKVGTQVIRVVGLTDSRSSVPEFQINSVKSCEKIFTQAPLPNTVVLLGAFSEKETDEIASHYPEVNWVVGSHMKSRDYNLQRDNQMWVAARDRARGITVVEVKGTLNPKTSLYHSFISPQIAQFKYSSEIDLARLPENKKASSSEQRYLSRYQNLATEVTALKSDVTVDFIDFEAQYDTPQNALHHLVEKYHQEVRKISMEE